MFDTRKVGKKIAELRKAKNMTQMELADAMGVSYQAVSNWERGNSMPDISKLPELAVIFGCSIDELLCDGKKSELVSHIISGNTEEYVKEQKVTLETVAEAAPVLKPNQTESLMDMVINENMDRLTTHDLIGIAPFVREEFLEKWLDEVDGVENIDGIIGLAPFLSKKTLDKLVEKLTKVGSLKDITGLAPFLSKKTLDKLVMKAIDAGQIEECNGLYPFLGQETLYKVADELVKKYGFKAIKGIAPFL